MLLYLKKKLCGCSCRLFRKGKWTVPLDKQSLTFSTQKADHIVSSGVIDPSPLSFSQPVHILSWQHRQMMGKAVIHAWQLCFLVSQRFHEVGGVNSFWILIIQINVKELSFYTLLENQFRQAFFSPSRSLGRIDIMSKWEQLSVSRLDK